MKEIDFKNRWRFLIYEHNNRNKLQAVFRDRHNSRGNKRVNVLPRHVAALATLTENVPIYTARTLGES